MYTSPCALVKVSPVAGLIPLEIRKFVKYELSKEPGPTPLETMKSRGGVNEFWYSVIRLLCCELGNALKAPRYGLYSINS